MNNSKSLIILIAVILAILAFAILNLFYNPFQSTGQVISDRYTYTKAICNSSNFCQDYEIVCENNQLTEMKPITGAFVQHYDEWNNPQTEEQKNRLC